jgi:hypothetical protein
MNREERNGYEIMRDERDIARDEAARLYAVLNRICWALDEDDPVELARGALALSAEAGDTDG